MLPYRTTKQLSMEYQSGTLHAYLFAHCHDISSIKPLQGTSQDILQKINHSYKILITKPSKVIITLVRKHHLWYLLH